jgi:hypothetical protein
MKELEKGNEGKKHEIKKEMKRTGWIIEISRPNDPFYFTEIMDIVLSIRVYKEYKGLNKNTVYTDNQCSGVSCFLLYCVHYIIQDRQYKEN